MLPSHKLVKPHILRGTRIIFAYRGANDSLAELEDISSIVQLGQSLLRHDLEESTKLRAWQDDLDWVVIRAGIAGCEIGAVQPYTLVNPPMCRHSASDASLFLRAALDT